MFLLPLKQTLQRDEQRLDRSMAGLALYLHRLFDPAERKLVSDHFFGIDQASFQVLYHRRIFERTPVPADYLEFLELSDHGEVETDLIVKRRVNHQTATLTQHLERQFDG